VGQNGGVIMVTFVPEFVSLPAYQWGNRQDSVARGFLAAVGQVAARDSVRSWTRSHPIPRPDVGAVADHLEHLRDVAGVDHVGLGSDFDGISATPVGLEDVATFPVLLAELIRRGWSDGDVKRVAGLNLLRVLREAERVAARLQRERPASTATIEQLDGTR
jgi:membrane dipeptidase